MRERMKIILNRHLKIQFKCSFLRSMSQIQQAEECQKKFRIKEAAQFYDLTLKILKDAKAKQYKEVWLKYFYCLIRLQQYQKLDQLVNAHPQYSDQKSVSIFNFVRKKTPLSNQCQNISFISLLHTLYDANSISSNQNIENVFYQKLIVKSQKTKTSIQTPQPTLILPQQFHPSVIFAFILLNLLSKAQFNKHSQYNNLCANFLKKAQSQGENDIVKALLITSINLLSIGQNINAEGMLHYCIGHKQSRGSILGNDQEWILTKLLMSTAFYRLKREEESKRLIQEYQKRFNLKSLILQSLIL